MPSEAILFLAAMMDENKTAKDWIGYGNLAPLFVTEWEGAVFNFFNGYVQGNGKLPPQKLMKEKFDDPFLAEAATSYSFDRMRDRYIDHTLRSGVEQSGTYLTDEDYNPDQAMRILSDALIGIRMAVNPNLLLDSLDAIPEVWMDYKTKLNLSDSDKGLMLGWPSIDKTTGGIEGGEVISIVGRPATGKTWFLLWLACKGWEQNRRCAFITLEMPAKQIIERQIGIMAEVNYAPIKSKIGMPEQQEQAIETFISGMAGVDDPMPFYTIDSRMAASVPDIETYTRAIQADVLYIDGAYLLRHENSQLNRYQKVAENMDLLKDMAMRLDIPVICSWQFNRDAAKKFKKKTEESPDLEDIGYSDAIGQHSSLVMGLLQEDGIETEAYRKVYILKGRGGEQGEFLVHWDFLKSNFGESNDAIGYGEIHINPA